jgi:hypothetical protein
VRCVCSVCFDYDQRTQALTTDPCADGVPMSTWRDACQLATPALAIAIFALATAACGDSEQTRSPSGGSGATGATGGTAGNGPLNCSGVPFPDEEQVARAVVALNSCTSDDGFYRTQVALRAAQDSFTYAFSFGPNFVGCVASITDGCDGVRRCMGLSTRQSETCDTCIGNVAVFCGSDVNALWDCDLGGATCSAGLCIPAGTTRCEPPTSSAACDAQGRPTQCDEYLQTGPACASFGLVCGDSGSGALCQGTGSACTGPVYPSFDVDYEGISCQGETLTACVDGKSAELDCGCFGPEFSCQNVDGTYFCGSASECDPKTFEKRCAGNSAEFCNAGKIVSVDCRELGFPGCTDDPRFGCAAL